MPANTVVECLVEQLCSRQMCFTMHVLQQYPEQSCPEVRDWSKGTCHLYMFIILCSLQISYLPLIYSWHKYAIDELVPTRPIMSIHVLCCHYAAHYIVAICAHSHKYLCRSLSLEMIPNVSHWCRSDLDSEPNKCSVLSFFNMWYIIGVWIHRKKNFTRKPSQLSLVGFQLHYKWQGGKVLSMHLSRERTPAVLYMCSVMCRGIGMYVLYSSSFLQPEQLNLYSG